jgi:hypothetical protein
MSRFKTFAFKQLHSREFQMVPNRLLGYCTYVRKRKKRKNAVSPSPATVAILRARHDGAEAASASEKPIEGGERRQWARAAAPGGPLSRRSAPGSSASFPGSPAALGAVYDDVLRARSSRSLTDTWHRHRGPVSSRPTAIAPVTGRGPPCSAPQCKAHDTAASPDSELEGTELRVGADRALAASDNRPSCELVNS